MRRNRTPQPASRRRRKRGETGAAVLDKARLILKIGDLVSRRRHRDFAQRRTAKPSSHRSKRPTCSRSRGILKKTQVLATSTKRTISLSARRAVAEFTVDSFRGKRFAAGVADCNAAQTVQNVVTYVVVLDVDNGELLLRRNDRQRAGGRRRTERCAACAQRGAAL